MFLLNFLQSEIESDKFFCQLSSLCKSSDLFVMKKKSERGKIDGESERKKKIKNERKKTIEGWKKIEVKKQ